MTRCIASTLASLVVAFPLDPLAANPGLVQSDILPVRLRPALCETDSGLVKPIGAERRLYADDHATRRIDRSCYLI